jgi:hypothetical protein
MDLTSRHVTTDLEHNNSISSSAPQYYSTSYELIVGRMRYLTITVTLYNGAHTPREDGPSYEPHNQTVFLRDGRTTCCWIRRSIHTVITESSMNLSEHILNARKYSIISYGRSDTCSDV